jgi:hypothetical protein
LGASPVECVSPDERLVQGRQATPWVRPGEAFLTWRGVSNDIAQSIGAWISTPANFATIDGMQTYL